MTIKQKLINNQQYVVSEYNSGKSTTKLAKEFGCNSGTVYLFLKEIGVITKRKSKTSHDINQLLDGAVNMFNNGLSIYTISKTLAVDNTTTWRYLKKHGCDTSRGCTQRDEPLINYTEEIIEEYLSGASAKSIGEKYGAGNSSVWKLLEKNGIETRNNSIWTINENYFDEINSRDRAVYLGFFASDGNNFGRGIRWQVCDRDILEEIARDMQYDGPIRLKKRSNDIDAKRQDQYLLYLGRRHLADKMTQWGCPPNKTHIMEFPTFLHKELIRSYILGYWLGDGSLNKQTWTITGNDKLIKPCMKYLDSQLNIKYQIYTRKKWVPNIVSAQVTQQANVLRVMRYLYEDHKVYMYRKHQKYLNIL